MEKSAEIQKMIEKDSEFVNEVNTMNLLINEKETELRVVKTKSAIKIKELEELNEVIKHKKNK